MSSKKRFADNHEHRFAISKPTLEDPTLVVCPKCGKMAKVFPFGEQPEIGYSMRIACTNCTYTKDKINSSQSFNWYGGDPTDGYFGHALWMNIPCCGRSLWAFNKRHLEFLLDFVSADLREREQDEYGWANSSLASRLPKWIQASKNREKVIFCLKKLIETAGYKA